MSVAAPSETLVDRRVLVPTSLPRSLPLGGGAPARAVWSFGGETMGPHWRARVVARAAEADPDAAAAEIRDLLTATFVRVVALMSPWEPASDLARFAAAEAGVWVTLAPETTVVLQRALAVAALTDGAYDPSIGAVTDLLGFGPTDARLRHAPDAAAVRLARGAMGFQKLAFEPAARRVRQPGGVRLDLCSIAKGYAVDLASDRLHAAGWTDHFIEIGGEARGRGIKPDGRPWWCQLELPAGSPATVAALCELAIATSGNTHRHHRDARGGSVGHIVPRRAGPAFADHVVTVLAPTCIEADAWATALHLLGPEEGRALAESQQLAAAWASPAGPHRPASEQRTTAFEALLA